MIVGAYTLDLYCDLPGNHSRWDPAFEQYVAQAGSTCRQDARRDGWKLNLRYGVAVCPACAGKGWMAIDAIEARDKLDLEEISRD